MLHCGLALQLRWSATDRLLALILTLPVFLELADAAQTLCRKCRSALLCGRPEVAAAMKC